ncbi:MAG: alkaline phosphatase family protein [Bacteroidetes bacterium]|nr:alkaline phosphatase family protein [Bacteroidota bacterium]
MKALKLALFSDSRRGPLGYPGLLGLMTTFGLFFAIQAYSQVPKMLGKPMQGAIAPTSAKVWAMVKDADEVELRVANAVYKFSAKEQKGWNGRIPVTFEVVGLEPGTTVEAELWANGTRLSAPFPIKTAAATVQPEWSFMVGSCAFYGVGAMRLVKPGQFTDIFDAMRDHPTDFMIWLGDNVYLLNGEWNSERRMYEKYTKARLDPHINDFLATRPNLAMLDDHDYGPDNAEGDFENKGATMGCFKDFWPNPYFGNGSAGTYTHFDYQDASFFMLDDRWFRESEDHKQVLGTEQMGWLQEKLLASTAPFKFIALGSQVLSEANQKETWSKFPERQVLFDFIKANKITGVVFLSGDRHFTELCKLTQDGLYPLYDFTSSPLTSPLRKRVNKPDDPEFAPPMRVPGTKFVGHNFGTVTISGTEGARTCKLSTWDASGTLVWEFTIKQTELDWVPD